MRRAVQWTAGIIGGLVAALLLVMALVAAFGDAPLRRYAEGRLNTVEGYHFEIGRLHVHPFILAMDLKEVVVTQTAHPDPPVAHIQDWHMSLQWREVIHGHLVSDHRMKHPVFHITLRQAKKEARDETPVHDRGMAGCGPGRLSLCHQPLRDR